MDYWGGGRKGYVAPLPLLKLWVGAGLPWPPFSYVYAFRFQALLSDASAWETLSVHPEVNSNFESGNDSVAIGGTGRVPHFICCAQDTMGL